jgi:hypothetical protein
MMIAVAYAHVLMELAAAVVAVAVAVRLLLSPARDLLQARRCRQVDRRSRPVTPAIDVGQREGQPVTRAASRANN